MKKFFALRYTFLLMALSAVLLQSCQDPKRKAIDLKLEAKDLVYKNQFNEAIDLLNKSLEYNNKDPETYFILGTAYYGLKKPDDAFTYYSKAIEVDPGYAQAYVNRGRMYKDRKDNDRACSDWKKAESLGVKTVREETKFCK